MSKLRIGNEDHADAADKHRVDAALLFDNGRFDAAAYLAGYVVECSLKAVLLHDDAFDPSTGKHDAAKLDMKQKALGSKKFGHKLLALAQASLGSEGARYMPDLDQASTTGKRLHVFEWSESWRYRPAGGVSQSLATAVHGWAEYVHEVSVLRMRADGVL